MATKSPGGTIELLIRRADNLYDVGSFGDRKIDPFVKCIPMWNDKCSKEKKDQWKATNYVDDAGVNPVVRCDTDTCQLLLIVVFSYYITTINSSLILADIYFCILFSFITFLQKNLFGRYPTFNNNKQQQQNKYPHKNLLTQFDEIKHEAKLSFAIPEKLSKPATFYIEVHDYDSFTGSDFIGSAEIDLTKLIFGKSKTNETPVALKRTKRKKQISAGTLFIKFTHVLPPPPEPRKKPVPKASKKKKNKNKELSPKNTPRTEMKETIEAMKILRNALVDVDLKETFDMADENEGVNDGNASYDEFTLMLEKTVNDEEGKKKKERKRKKVQIVGLSVFLFIVFL